MARIFILNGIYVNLDILSDGSTGHASVFDLEYLYKLLNSQLLLMVYIGGKPLCICIFNKVQVLPMANNPAPLCECPKGYLPFGLAWSFGELESFFTAL